MNDRIQQVLDGDLDRHSLTVREQAELLEAESMFDATLRAVPIEPLPLLGGAVLDKIESRRGAHRATTQASTGWFWRRRSLSFAVRPVWALAAAVLVGVVTLQVLRSDVGTSTTTDDVLIRFVLRAPDATSVSLAGDFSGWQPAYSLTRADSGIWTVVVPLAPGIHTYSFVIDGERWVPDPMAPAVNDGFGGLNSRLAVLRPDDGRT